MSQVEIYLRQFCAAEIERKKAKVDADILRYFGPIFLTPPNDGMRFLEHARVEHLASQAITYALINLHLQGKLSE